MMNGMGFRGYQSMNMIHRTKEGTEIWLGDYMAASNVSGLKQKSINHVLTCAAMLDINYSKEHNINHKIINAFDIPSYKMTPHFEEAFRFIEESLKKGNILVHCAAGISRSTTFVLVYLMRAQKMSFQQAMGYVRCKRSVICPNYGFQNQLKKYQLELKRTKFDGKQEENEYNYEISKQKKPTFLFSLDNKKRPLGKEERFSVTSGQNRNYQSEKYANKASSSLYPRGKSINEYQKQRLHIFGDYKSNINRIGKDLMSYKLQIPKIITIKK